MAKCCCPATATNSRFCRVNLSMVTAMVQKRVVSVSTLTSRHLLRTLIMFALTQLTQVAKVKCSRVFVNTSLLALYHLLHARSHPQFCLLCPLLSPQHPLHLHHLRCLSFLNLSLHLATIMTLLFMMIRIHACVSLTVFNHHSYTTHTLSSSG